MPARLPTSAPAAPSYTPPIAADALSAAPGSRAAALELVEGIAEALAVEADGAEDYLVVATLTYLLVDVLEARDAIEDA